MHEPQTECIAKGKAHKRYEFGVKTGLVTSARLNWILGARTFPGNPYDGHTLQQALEQAKRITGVEPEQACADLGYRKSGYEGACDIQIVNRFRKTPDRSLLRWWKRRSAIEPVIGHVREDHSREGPLSACRRRRRRPSRPADRRRLQPPQADEGAQAPLFVPFSLPLSQGLADPPTGCLTRPPEPPTDGKHPHAPVLTTLRDSKRVLHERLESLENLEFLENLAPLRAISGRVKN